MRLSSVISSTLLVVAAQLACADDAPKLPEVSITQERVIECPAVLDARSFNDAKSIKDAITKEVFKDVPYELKAVSKEFTLTAEDALQGQYWLSKGGKVTLEEEGSRVSKLTCSYSDYYKPTSEASFTVTFTKRMKVHVAKHLPQFTLQNVFAPTTCISDEQGSCELSCTSTAGYETTQAPYCKFTPAFVVVSNKIDAPKTSSQNFGALFVYPYLEGSERIKVLPGKDVLFPVKKTNHFALKMSTPKYGEPFTLTHLCMADSWVDDQLYAAYGVSPHITVTGEIDEYGTTASMTDMNTMGYGCSVSCSVTSSNCWGGWRRWFTADTPKTKDLNRDVLLSRLGPMRDTNSATKSIRVLQEEVEKADLFKEFDYEPSEKEKKADIDELRKDLATRRTFMTRFEQYIQPEDKQLKGKELEKAVYTRVLGVSPDASKAEIKSAYRKLSMNQHPDKKDAANGNDAQFEDIGDAYKFLKDEL